MADPIVNFFSSTLVGGYSDSDTELTLATGSGANLPDPSVDGEFNLVIYNESEIFVTTTFDGGSTDTRQDLASTNPEIVRVTARSGDVLTVTRAQEGTTASAKEATETYRVILASTKKVFDDINTAIANVNLTTLTGVEELTFDSTGDEEFGLPAGTTAQRPSSPSAGYMRWNSTDSRIEVYNGSRWAGLSEIGFQQADLGVAELSVTANDAVFEEPIFVADYLVVAGGGGTSDSGTYYASGGGAGGLRTSYGATSGGGSSSESSLTLTAGTSYTVTVGGGGAVGASNTDGGKGSDSVFSTVTSEGGGYGAKNDNPGGSGGSGGGAGGNDVANSGGSGTANQGFDGGDVSSGSGRGGAGGGGASSAGGNHEVSYGGGVGGDGLAVSISGSSVNYSAGGGGLRGFFGIGTDAPAGSGWANTANRGHGAHPVTNDAGSSGVVIIRYPASLSISIGAGLTGSETTDGSDKVATITAGTGNVSWTQA